MTTPLAPTPVDLDAIEHELTALWQSAAESAEAGRGAPVTRTCLVSLVVTVGDAADAERVTAALEQLTGVYPHRAIVVAARPDPPDPARAAPPIQAWVQAHCRIPAPGRPQVCGEQITIEAYGEAAARVPGVVLPLLAPDVPVALWLPRGEPADHPVARRLAPSADRVIVDSATFAAPEQGLAAVAGLLDADTTVSDLAWSRLTGWRELLAQFFDAASMRRHLDEVERVRITVPGAATGADRSQGLLLLGWLASRLGWHVGGGGTPVARADGAAVRVEIVPVDRLRDGPERIAAIAIVCPRAQFTVARGADDTVITRVRAEGMWPIQRTVRLERLETAALLAGELQLLGRDHTFESALGVAAALARLV